MNDERTRRPQRPTVDQRKPVPDDDGENITSTVEQLSVACKQWREGLTLRQSKAIELVHRWAGRYVQPAFEHFEANFLYDKDVNKEIAEWIRISRAVRKAIVRSLDMVSPPFIDGDHEDPRNVKFAVSYLCAISCSDKADRIAAYEDGRMTADGIDLLEGCYGDPSLSDADRIALAALHPAAI